MQITTFDHINLLQVLEEHAEEKSIPKSVFIKLIIYTAV